MRTTAAVTTATRTLTKTVTYRAVSMANTMAVAYWMTGSTSVAASMGMASLLFSSALYFTFETLWTAFTAKPRMA